MMAHMVDEELGITWHDSAWIPMLNITNVLDYFARSRFYDRTCNNEVIKMQRQSPDQLLNMTGLEYKLVHYQLPILYVIRKQHRHSPENVTPIALFYIIAGIIYKAPDLRTLINSRMLNASHFLNSALNKAVKHARYHPSKGYWWDFTEDKVKADEAEPAKEQASWFQRQRVDLLLGELVRQYPMKFPAPVAPPPEQDTKPDAADTQTGVKRPATEPAPADSQPSAKMMRVKTEKGT